MPLTHVILHVTFLVPLKAGDKRQAIFCNQFPLAILSYKTQGSRKQLGMLNFSLRASKLHVCMDYADRHFKPNVILLL